MIYMTFTVISSGGKVFKRENFEIRSTGTIEGSGNKNKTAKSFDVSICFKFLKVFFIVS